MHTILTGLDNEVLVHRCVEDDSESDGTVAHCAILIGCHSDVRDIFHSNQFFWLTRGRSAEVTLIMILQI